MDEEKLNKARADIKRLGATFCNECKYSKCQKDRDRNIYSCWFDENSPILDLSDLDFCTHGKNIIGECKQIEPIRAIDVAEYIIYICNKDKRLITNLNLQNILYLIQEKSLLEDEKYLFFDNFEAWQFGPCISNIYYRYCGSGAMPIYSVKEPKISFNQYKSYILTMNRLPFWELSRFTKKIGGAWEKNYSGPGTRNIIPINDIVKLGGV